MCVYFFLFWPLKALYFSYMECSISPNNWIDFDINEAGFYAIFYVQWTINWMSIEVIFYRKIKPKICAQFIVIYLWKQIKIDWISSVFHCSGGWNRLKHESYDCSCSKIISQWWMCLFGCFFRFCFRLYTSHLLNAVFHTRTHPHPQTQAHTSTHKQSPIVNHITIL